MAAKEKRTGLDNIRLVPDLTSQTQTEVAAQSETQPSYEKQSRTSSKPDIKQHTAYLPLAVHEQLRKLAFEEDKKIHDYLLEGLNLVFRDRGLKSINELTGQRTNGASS